MELPAAVSSAIEDYEEPAADPDFSADAAIVRERQDEADLAELEAELEAAVGAKTNEHELAKRYARLKRLAGSRHPDHELERQHLIASIRQLEEGLVWVTTANVALFHEQTCTTCASTHRFFQGWMTEQLHKTDAGARRLLKGHSVERLPERVEIHQQGTVDTCFNCVECCIAINLAAEA